MRKPHLGWAKSYAQIQPGRAIKRSHQFSPNPSLTDTQTDPSAQRVLLLSFRELLVPQPATPSLAPFLAKREAPPSGGSLALLVNAPSPPTLAS